MRSATADDTAAVAALIRARCDWMEARGMESWRESADEIAAQCSNEFLDHWILQHADGRVVGTTTVQKFCPPWGWTEAELAESADYLYTTITDPAFSAWRPGTLIAWWALDRAARQGTAWVRRGCTEVGLRDYYAAQGFEVFHEVQKTRFRYYLMGRRAEVMPEVEGLFAAPERMPDVVGRHR